MRKLAQDKSSYSIFFEGVQQLLEQARKSAARSINSIIVATHWELGRRIVQFEQAGKKRAGYGDELLVRLSGDLSQRFGRGFGLSQLKMARQFFLTYPTPEIRQSVIGQSAPSKKSQSLIGQLPGGTTDLANLAKAFPLSWTHYARLLRVSNPTARAFYETEALRGGWSIRQLERQIGSQYYERTALSKNKRSLLQKGAKSIPDDRVRPEDEIKDPYVLEFLNLKDEYSETDLEAALIHHLETFLLELGSDFAFVARQKRLRVGNEWYRVDLVFYHRRLRALVLIDLKLNKFTHADAGQMHLYLNYAQEHWTHPDENPPVGLILCAEKDAAVAHYALSRLPNKILAAEYKTALPKEGEIAKEIEHTRALLVTRLSQGAREKT